MHLSSFPMGFPPRKDLMDVDEDISGLTSQLFNSYFTGTPPNQKNHIFSKSWWHLNREAIICEEKKDFLWNHFIKWWPPRCLKGVAGYLKGIKRINRGMKSNRPPLPPFTKLFHKNKFHEWWLSFTIYYCPGDISLQKMGPFHPNELAFAEKVLDVFCCTKLDDKSRSSSQSVFCWQRTTSKWERAIWRPKVTGGRHTARWR